MTLDPCCVPPLFTADDSRFDDDPRPDGVRGPDGGRTDRTREPEDAPPPDPTAGSCCGPDGC